MLCEHVYRYNEERNKDSRIEKREKHREKLSVKGRQGGGGRSFKLHNRVIIYR